MLRASKAADEVEFLRSLQLLDRVLAGEGGALRRRFLDVHDTDAAPPARVGGAFPRRVLRAAARDVRRDPRVERAVTATRDVDIPALGNESGGASPLGAASSVLITGCCPPRTSNSADPSDFASRSR